MKRSGGFSPPTQPSKKQNAQESFIGSMFGTGFGSAARQGMRFLASAAAKTTAAVAAAAAPKPDKPINDPRFKFHNNWPAKFPNYTYEVHEQTQKLLEAVKALPDSEVLSHKDAKTKEYFDTMSKENKARLIHAGKKEAIVQIVNQMPDSNDLKALQVLLEDADSILRQNDPNHNHPAFPVVRNMIAKFKACSKEMGAILSHEEPVPILHPDCRIELMGLKKNNPKALVDYAKHIVQTFGEDECPNAVAILKRESVDAPARVTRHKGGGRGSTPPDASDQPAPAAGDDALDALADVLDQSAREKSKKAGNVTKVPVERSAVEKFNQTVHDAVIQALDAAQKKPNADKKADDYYMNVALEAAEAVAEAVYPGMDGAKAGAIAIAKKVYNERFPDDEDDESDEDSLAGSGDLKRAL